MHETAMQLTRITANGRARAAALEAAARTEARATSLVAYASKGALVILGPGREALAAAERLAPALECTVVVTDDAQGNGPEGVTVVREKPLQVSGHLGQFNVIVAARPPLGGENLLRKLGGPRTHFDLVLDLCRPAHIGAPLPPFGYYAPSEPEALERALAELPEMVGEFEKAKFFQYDPSICAHGRSGLSGCTRCIDACPTWAIISMGDEIAVDPYLCQGAGACATACPTGAITYAYPRPGDSIDKLGALLKAYRAAGGEGAIVVFHDAEHGREALADLPAPLPERVIPIEIAEQGSVGMDVWLSLLAFGASEVWLYATQHVPGPVREEIEAQLSYARAILAGMGHDGGRLRLLDGDLSRALGQTDDAGGAADYPPATYAGVDEKRTMLRLAVEHLYQYAPAPRAEAALPDGAPFGEIRVDREKCTLCMSCVGVCPSHALADGTDLPQLNFIEANCVQCGLCEKACPEDAITLQARYLYDPSARRQSRVLNEEVPFHCVRCGKPFATRKMMDRMSEKLGGHWMFQKPEALRRLQMCGDCRVRDMFELEAKRPGQGFPM
ncbi:4Fe-4S ferredoxin [Sulfurifustis variabilis]|uniref:4Fe-4S ferredoxin n=1 Tax=Sulfurifustis variabilis TaxID=1675686 RepID=A0A1B4VE36_9GAMM|nr:4Fe-4S binding protein [Sulfurifustis variabilis]BAU48887.1 4Fe-4S ferredoxin [Sulfurifustis variabilis]